MVSLVLVKIKRELVKQKTMGNVAMDHCNILELNYSSIDTRKTMVKGGIGKDAEGRMEELKKRPSWEERNYLVLRMDL